MCELNNKLYTYLLIYLFTYLLTYLAISFMRSIGHQPLSANKLNKELVKFSITLDTSKITNISKDLSTFIDLINCISKKLGFLEFSLHLSCEESFNNPGAVSRNSFSP